MVSKNKMSGALMSVPPSPCNSGSVFLGTYLLCAKNQAGSGTNAHGFQALRTLGKKGAPLFSPVSCR